MKSKEEIESMLKVYQERYAKAKVDYNKSKTQNAAILVDNYATKLSVFKWVLEIIK